MDDVEPVERVNYEYENPGKFARLWNGLSCDEERSGDGGLNGWGASRSIGSISKNGGIFFAYDSNGYPDQEGQRRVNKHNVTGCLGE